MPSTTEPPPDQPVPGRSVSPAPDVPSATVRIVRTDDGVDLHAEERGAGPALLFVHEFGGDHRSWRPQVDRLVDRYRCLTYNARGYPPSSVPRDPDAYSQERAVTDAVAVLDAFGVDRAHVVGNSMGGFATLHLGLRHPDRARSLVVAGCGYGAVPDRAESFRADALATAEAYEQDGAAAVARDYGARPARLHLRRRDPAAYDEHLRILAEHDPTGAALTMRGVQASRPSLYALRDELARLAVPVLLMVGDEDTEAIAATLMLRATLPDVGLAMLPRAGHLTNLEQPEMFTALVDAFHAEVDAR